MSVLSSYELFDEVMDFGYPQTTESKILQEYITQESHKLEVQVRPPMAVTNAVSWRSEGIRYRKNEVFLDVVESVNLLVNANGNVVRSEILGAVKMKCYLSGMPELRLGLNDKVMFESTGRSKPTTFPTPLSPLFPSSSFPLCVCLTLITRSYSFSR